MVKGLALKQCKELTDAKSELEVTVKKLEEELVEIKERLETLLKDHEELE